MDKSTNIPTVAIAGLILALLVLSAGPVIAAGEEDAGHRLGRARQLLEERQAAEALAAFTALINEQPSFAASIGAARASALLDRPGDALRHYRTSLGLPVENETDYHVALLGVARMLLWLEQYEEAERAYRELLSMSLAGEDRAAAAAGLVRSLSLQDKPIRAYRSVPVSGSLSSLERMELARAALWAGWPDRAATLLEQEIPVEPGTRLAREIETLRSAVRAETANPVTVQAEYVADNDNLRIRKAELAAGTKAVVPGNLGLVYRHQGFEQNDMQLAMNSVQARYDLQMRETFGITAQAGPAKYGDWRTTIGTGSAVYRPNDELRYELFYNREGVETLAALERHIRFDAGGAGVTYSPVSRFSVAGALYRQSFSDDNNRRGGTARVTAALFEPGGVTAELRGRAFEDSRTDATGYFNPERYTEVKLLIGLDRRLGSRWHLHALAGPGRERITPGDGSTNTALARVSLDGRVADSISASFNYGYSNSSVASSSGYRRQYSGVTLVYRW